MCNLRDFLPLCDFGTRGNLGQHSLFCCGKFMGKSSIFKCSPKKTIPDGSDQRLSPISGIFYIATWVTSFCKTSSIHFVLLTPPNNWAENFAYILPVTMKKKTISPQQGVHALLIFHAQRDRFEIITQWASLFLDMRDQDCYDVIQSVIGIQSLDFGCQKISVSTGLLSWACKFSCHRHLVSWYSCGGRHTKSIM